MSRNLYPREHGAYVQLGFPLLSGLLLGDPGVAAYLLAGAAALLFLAYEPLAVMLGVRGNRLREELGARARWHLALRAGLGTAAGFCALWLAPAQARWLALVPLAFAGGVPFLLASKRLKTFAGEALAAAAFAAMHLPVAAAGGVAGTQLWGPPVMWFATTVVATLAVHAIKSRVTGAAPWAEPAAAWSARLALLAALAAAVLLAEARSIALAASVPLACVLVLNRLAISTKRLMRVGWMLAAANAFALAVLAAGA